ncbi:hypothetical protein [Absidia glauca]|uniref:Uncharacterized protein n=1 Tax=Absidia glauca TaxID=4829 RepID=A0A168PH47_ABSGL|nr:hypothetical protein [Absidia glauca]
MDKRVGLCFCLRKANRLVPNRYSFPLILRGGGGEESNRRGGQQNQFTTIDDEESRQGLLNDFNDQDDSDGEHEQVDTHRYHHDPIQSLDDHNGNDDLEGDEFGDLQGADDSDNDEVPAGARQKTKKPA